MRISRVSRSVLWALLLTCAIGGTGLAVAIRRAPLVGAQGDGRFVTPTGHTLTPAGTHIEVSDRPLGMAFSPDRSLLAVATGANFGQRSLHLIDARTNVVKQTFPLGNSFVGVDFSPTGDTIYVGGGAANDVKFFTRAADGSYAAAGVLSLPGAAPSGLDVSADGTRLYVALNLLNQLAVIDTTTRTVLARIPVGTYPYTAVLSADGSKVYVSNWGGKVPGPDDFTDGMFPVVVDKRTGIPVSGTVSVVDTRLLTVQRHIEVGLHPTGMALAPSGDRLYVTNANSDTISVVDTSTDTVNSTLQVGVLGPGRKPILGSSPNAVAVSPDGRTLYVANAAQNAVAVVDARASSQKAVQGFIPTGWYPTAVSLDASRLNLYIASGYGFGSIAPTPPTRAGRSYQDRQGVVSVLPVPDKRELARLTDQVETNNASLPAQEPDHDGRACDDRRHGHGLPPGHPIPMHTGQRSPIKHVFYIIKENRTYDQVFGDVAQGNGDPTLVQFGRDVTPNHHALAQQFVLLDNYYGPGDQSALGHRWCLQAYPSTWTHKYSNARNDQNPMLLGPTEAIYDNAKARGLSVRAFGERGRNTITPSTATWTDIYNDWKNGTKNVQISAQAVIVGLRDIYHPAYPAAEARVPDQYRADIFLKEFAQYEKDGNLPELTLILLYEDHTEGTSPGFPTPRAMVADNDRALGRVVEAISKSRYWKESAIFVTEDDSQDGLDHVDGHRTVGLVISPYTRTGAVDSSFYTIINMYRTMEQILGLPPLNQFDLAAQPMFTAFTNRPDFTPYTALPSNIPLDEMNPRLAGLTGLQRRMAEFSMTIDTSEPDSAPADLLNRAIWHSVKGWKTPYNYGRPIVRRHASFDSLVRLAGSY
jgi:YVTN family beta-propeller protein